MYNIYTVHCMYSACGACTDAISVCSGDGDTRYYPTFRL